MKLSNSDKKEIIKLCREDGLSPAMVAPRYGVSRQAIWKMMRREGIDTSKTAIKSTCAFCGAPIDIPRPRYRRGLGRYCGMDCYYAHVNERQDGDFVDDAVSRRKARGIVAKHFGLLPGYVVHHKNRDSRDNALGNLAVFRTHGEHMSYHRGGSTKPIWDGAAAAIH